MSGPARVSLEPAWILHRRPYRDTSLILELLTVQHGRVPAVARGARGPRSRRGGSLEPFRPLLVSWSGRGEMVTLTGAEPRGPSRVARGVRLMSMFYVNELLLRLTERHDPHPDLFADYERALAGLSGPADERATLRIFEKRLLAALGYGLNLETEAGSGEAVREERVYEYRLESGPVRLAPGGDAARAIPGSSLLALAAERLEGPDALRHARELLGAALDLYLGGRRLRSREVLRAMRARTATGRLLAE